MREQAISSPLRGNAARIALVSLVAAALTFDMTYSAAGGHRKTAEIVLAVAGLAAIVHWTRWALIGWFVLVASVLPTRVLPVSAGGIRSDLAELVGFAILLAVALRWAMGEDLRRPAFVVPLLVLVAGAAFGAGIAYWHGAGRSIWLAPLKTLLLYLLPLAAIALHRRESDVRQLERWVLRLCVVASLVALASVAVGLGKNSHKQVITLGLASDANRLRPAVLNLVVLGVLLLLARCVHEGVTWKRVAAFVIFTALVALSFTRSTWAPLVLAMVLFVVGRPGARVPLRGLRSGLIILGLGAIAFTAASAGLLGPSMKAVTSRAESVGNTQVLQENSFQDRANENTIAWAAMSGHRLEGLGLGEPYGAIVLEHDPTTGQTVREPRRFIHNSYLNTWIGLGIIGVVAWALFAVSVTRRALRARLDPSPSGTRAFAAACALLATGLEAVFQTDLYNRSVIATVTCALVFLASYREPDKARA